MLRRSVKLLAFSLLAATAACAQTAPLEFSGYLKVGEHTRFVLTDREGKSSNWLSPGQSFRGFTVIEFDPKEEVLALRHADGTARLPLKQAKIEDRDAVLAMRVDESEARQKAGQGTPEDVFLSRVALLAFRRDRSPDVESKFKLQHEIVFLHQFREKTAKARRAAGVATDIDVLERTEDLLRAEVVLAELKRALPAAPPSPASRP